MRVSFNWLKDYVDIRTSPEAMAEKLTMAGLEVTSLTRVDQDAILEIEITPNRADCLSMLGIAREVAAITGKKMKAPKISSFRGKSSAIVPIQIQAKALCPRYLGRVIKNIRVGASPEWLAQRLEMMGVRSVNNIVDITNFCLLEFGQPLHAFDLDKLQGRRITVREVLEGEQIVTIDAVKRDLEAGMLVIADKVSPQAIAGIMGSKDSEVGETTTNILLESAYFDPLTIRNTSRKLGLATQSSYRFERGVNLEGVYLASCRATELIQKLSSPGKGKRKAVTIGRLIDKRGRGLAAGGANRVGLRYAKVKAALGVEVSAAQIKEFMRLLKFTIVRSSKDRIIVDIPGFRQDISREADLIEEVARLYGYDNIPVEVSRLAPNLSCTAERRLASEENYEAVRQILSSAGLNEIMTYSLISRQALRKLELPSDNLITVKNPLSYEQEILRPTLLTGMLNTMLININRKNADLRLFELSRVYFREDGVGIKESPNLCIAVAGKKEDNWLEKSREYCFFDLKGIVETLLGKLGVKDFRFAEKTTPFFIPGRSSSISLGEENCGFLGEVKREILGRFGISSAVYAGEIALHKFLTHIQKKKKFVSLTRFPSAERDISLIAPQEILSRQIVSLINKTGREKIVKVTLFDQYFGEQIPVGFRGLTYSIKYRASDRTLTAEEVDKLHAQIRRSLAGELKVQLR